MQKPATRFVIETFQLIYSCGLLRLRVESDWSQNNKHSRNNFRRSWFTVRIFMVTMKTSTKTSTNSTKYKILGNVMTFGAIWLNTNNPPALNGVNVYFCRKAFFVLSQIGK